MDHPNISSFLIYLLVGIIVLSYLPTKTRIYMIVILILGAGVYMKQSGKSFQGLIDAIKGN